MVEGTLGGAGDGGGGFEGLGSDEDPLVEHPEVATHPWVASMYLIQGQLEGPERRSGL